MIDKIKEKGSVIFFISATILLTLSYAFNVFHIADNNYKFFDKSDEGNIISRLLMSRNEGMLSEGGLTGNYSYYQYKLQEGDDIPSVMSHVLDGDVEKIEDLDYRTIVSQRYDDYINNREIYGGVYLAYKTQPGGQAFMYVVLDWLLPIDEGNKLILFRLITIILSSIILALFLKWVFNNYGFAAAVVTFLLIFISPWPFRFAYNLWWALWSYYIPFIFLLLFLDKKRKDNKPQLDFKFYSLLCLAVFVKFFFTGAEFLTSTLVMTICPIIYHLYLTKQSFKSSIAYLVKSSAACIAGVLLGMMLLIMQIRLLEGTWQAGFSHIINSFISILAPISWVAIFSEHAYTHSHIDYIVWYMPYLLYGYCIIGVFCQLCMSRYQNRVKNYKEEY